MCGLRNIILVLVCVRLLILDDGWSEMDEVKLEECCLENKQSAVVSSSSVSETSESINLKSPGVCSPTPDSSAAQR